MRAQRVSRGGKAWRQARRTRRAERARVIARRTRRAERAPVMALSHVVEVDDEDQRLPRLDRGTGATLAVGQVRGDRQLTTAADLHALDALVPAGDDHADPEAEGERLAPVPRGVELLTGGVRDADVVRADGVARLRLAAVALDEVLYDEVSGRVTLREVDLGLRAVGVECHAAGAFRPWWRFVGTGCCGCQYASRMSTTNTRVSVPEIFGGLPALP